MHSFITPSPSEIKSLSIVSSARNETRYLCSSSHAIITIEPRSNKGMFVQSDRPVSKARIPNKAKSLIGFDPLLERGDFYTESLKNVHIHQQQHPLINESYSAAGDRSPLSARPLKDQNRERSYSEPKSHFGSTATSPSRNQRSKIHTRHFGVGNRERCYSEPQTNSSPSDLELHDRLHEQTNENNYFPASVFTELHNSALVEESSRTIHSLAKPSPTSFFTGREVVRSTEPSTFQLEIPAVDEFIANSRLCNFMDEYRKEDMNMDLHDSLAGVPRHKLQAFLLNKRMNPSSPYLVEAHKPIVESLLECADDVELACCFHQTNEYYSFDDRTEVAIFQRQHQFIVLFRGRKRQQQGKLFKGKTSKVFVPLDPNEPAERVLVSVRDDYMNLEAQVFKNLDRLIDQNPFCDVVFTGNSFGAAMATLGAVRYATARAAIRVSCQTFGAPKVGNQAFRNSSNSLPNLKVVRVEYGNDTKCHTLASGCHIGHSVIINSSFRRGKGWKGGSKPAVVAYKFDSGSRSKKLISLNKERTNEEYLAALEEIKRCSLPWVRSVAGQNIDESGRGKEN